MRGIFLILGALFVVACFDSDRNPGFVCTDEVRPSLIITAEDEIGNEIAPDTILVTREDGTEVFLDCAEVDALGTCLTFMAGQEEAGTFIVEGTFGDQIVTAEVTVDADQCHVNTQSVVLVFVV